MEKEGSILGNNDNSLLSIPSAWPQEPMICQFWGIIIYIGDYEACPHMMWLKSIITVRKRTLRRLCFYRCLSVHRRCMCGGGCMAVGQQEAQSNSRKRALVVVTTLAQARER